MLKHTYTSFKSHLIRSSQSRFLRDQEGVAAIEFAFIAPILLFMYFGMAEVASAISVDRQISHSANVAGDLSTQSETVSAAEMSEIMTATMMVMGIPDSKKNGVTIEIASYARASDNSLVPKGIATLKGSNGKDLPVFNAGSLDQRILSSTSGVVVARVNYIYEPLKLRYMPSDFDIRETFMLKPRKSANVDILDANGGTSSNKYSCTFTSNGPNCVTNGNIATPSS